MTDHDQHHDTIRVAIAWERAKNLEAARAFGEVLQLRTDATIVKTKLTAVLAEQAQYSRPTSPEFKRWRDRSAALRRLIEEIEGALVTAEAYCRSVAPGRLERHDEELAAEFQATQEAREAEIAARDKALASGRQRAATRAAERMAERAIIKAAETALFDSARSRVQADV